MLQIKVIKKCYGWNFLINFKRPKDKVLCLNANRIGWEVVINFGAELKSKKCK